MAPKTTTESSSIPFYRDERVLQVLGQVVVIGLVIGLGYFLIRNLIDGLSTQGIRLGFDFMRITAGFDIGESLIEYSRSSNVAQALFVGLLNTLLVSILGIIFSTILGIIIGVARLSNNWLVSRLASIFIEFMRNIPLLVLLFFLATAVFFNLPSTTAPVQLFDLFFFTNRGVFIPWVTPTASFAQYLVVVLIALALAILVGYLLYRRGKQTGRMPLYWLWATLAFLVVLAIGWFFFDPQPLTPTRPVLQGRNYVGGQAFTPEFMALLLGLVIYTAAFIAEIVRAGIQSVGKGQREAATALGLGGFQTLRLVIFPQAMRVIVPPLTSQYLNLTKNSSLAVAVGYPDLFAVGRTVINQSGRAVEVTAITMVIYLSFSLITAAFMNWYNKRIQLVER
ncbi:MAG: ABC transporter permease subunit [Caldilineales bacterium]|nr:ABC transporter permease subunit [Caldilineales bacterium]